MVLKTIMVQLDVDAIAAPRISMAWDLAQRYEADLIGFSAAQPHFITPSGSDDQAATKALWCQVDEIEACCLLPKAGSPSNGNRP
ncbi:hypothetical protein [Mesorhizobium sp.]|uniref:hypothetical protein n=1 Tax=Mesorhizobium sp. TaxID=1871066 RepID=UPI000FE84386|nr:hypothetical protein [Mesorhizobium sp.]RWC26643.1 MAG: hypothetical protein EOS27_24300 [Mesorhizobium sp.]TIX22080.1 MAG: hypothetical protein E5V35_27150 [Mesorhizobium sp.]